MPKLNNNLYEFKYEGEFNSIDSLTVLHSQINFVNIIREIKDHKFPEISLKIKLKGVENGSLDINHVIEVGTITGMFVLDNYTYISTIFKIFGDIIKIKKFLKGDQAEEVKTVGNNKVEIHFHGNNIQVHPDALKIYQNSPVITNAFNNTSKLLLTNQDIDFIELTDKHKNKRILKINKPDFNALGKENPYLLKKTDEQIYQEQILFIKKPNLFPDKKGKWIWNLIHQGRDIQATILDENFKRRINGGLKVGQGDRLKANLKIFYKFDKRLNTFIESNRFEVTNITDIIERSPESEFNF